MAPLDRARRWIVVDGGRMMVTAVLLATVFGSLLVVSLLWQFRITDMLTETRVIQTLFNTLLSGTILLVSIVVSINSVALSQELGSLGTHLERTESAFQYRERLEEFSRRGTTPVVPESFIRYVLDTIEEQAEELDRTVRRDAPGEVHEYVEPFVDAVDGEVDTVKQRLDGIPEHSPTVLIVALAYDYAWQIYAIRRIQSEYGAALSDEDREAFDGMLETLKFFESGRDYFKTLYIQQEMSRLSTQLLVVSLPAILYISYVLLAIGAGRYPEIDVLPVPSVVIFVSLSYAIALAPYLLLTAYILRIASVSTRSLATGPFTVGSRRTPEVVERLDDESSSEDTYTVGREREGGED
jgi:hypothetical protein